MVKLFRKKQKKIGVALVNLPQMFSTALLVSRSAVNVVKSFIIMLLFCALFFVASNMFAFLRQIEASFAMCPSMVSSAFVKLKNSKLPPPPLPLSELLSRRPLIPEARRPAAVEEGAAFLLIA